MLSSLPGLRFMSGPAVQSLLQLTRSVMSNASINPFQFSETAGVAVLSGEEEGVYSWIAANYLHGFFDDNRLDTTDIGGLACFFFLNHFQTAEKKLHNFSINQYLGVSCLLRIYINKIETSRLAKCLANAFFRTLDVLSSRCNLTLSFLACLSMCLNQCSKILS